MPDRFRPPRPRDIRGPGRFLLWLVTSQLPRGARGAALGSAWMVGLAVPPYLLSRAVDDGLVRGDAGALTGWALALLGAGVGNAALGVARHRTMTKVRMDAIGIVDVQVIAQSLTAVGPGLGAVVACAAIAAVLLSISPLLAVVVLAGVPLLKVRTDRGRAQRHESVHCGRLPLPRWSWEGIRSPVRFPCLRPNSAALLLLQRLQLLQPVRTRRAMPAARSSVAACSRLRCTVADRYVGGPWW